MAVGQVIRVTLHTTFRNQAAINVLHYAQMDTLPATPINLAGIESFAGWVANNLGTPLKECLAQEASYDGCVVRLLAIHPWNDIETRSTLNAGLGGAPSGGAGPSQVCGLIRKRGSLANRRNRGRFYIPFPPKQAWDDDDLVAGAYRVVAEDLATAMLEEVQILPLQDAWPVVPVLVAADRLQPPQRITATSVANGFATQRRRGYFGRPNVSPF